MDVLPVPVVVPGLQIRGRPGHPDPEIREEGGVGPKKINCLEHNLSSTIFGTFVVKFLACLPLLRF